MNESLEEMEWKVAGELALALHLHDARAGWLSYVDRNRDHKRLERFGYDVSGCVCADTISVVQVDVWRPTVA